jgi:translation initiation factor IF-2
LAKAKRVFEVAKGLGVTSKAIVVKCQAEGVPDITNHMSTVKLGLEATVREWFSESHQTVTATETTDHVDLVKAKAKPRRRAAKANRTTAVSTDAPEAVDTATMAPVAPLVVTAPVEPPVPEPPVDKPAQTDSTTADEPTVVQRPKARKATRKKPPPAPPPVVPEPEPAAPTAIEPEPETPETEPQTPAVAAEALQPTEPVGQPNVPRRPEGVTPVGPQLTKPESVHLKGPNVVRVEAPDQVAPLRTRRSTSTGPPVARPLVGGGVGLSRDTQNTPAPGADVARGRDATRDAEPSGEADSKTKRRSLTTRRGRYAESLPTGPTQFSDADLAELDARLKGAGGFIKKRRQSSARRGQATSLAATLVETGGKVEIEPPLFIKDLSGVTGIKAADILKYLLNKGIMSTINSVIDAETAVELAMEYDIELIVKERQTAEEVVIEEFEKRALIDVRPRPPVVTVLGHVDHGKTSLLDCIRKLNDAKTVDVASHEAGGITQHVGAYRVTIPGNDGKDRTVVFLDTPGHEAFTAMRARGANMTDIVVLVVAADDGVMPQTIESINHSHAAGVPIVVALNKIDQPAATTENIQKIYGQLAEHGLNPTEWGGSTEIIKTSATQGIGVTDLVEMLDYQAELLELQADYGGPARGTVIEAEMHLGRGPVARVLVQQGHLKVGDFIVIGRAFGRVRDMSDNDNQSIREAGPATPLELSGIGVVPDAGDRFYVTDSLRGAEDIADQYRERERHEQLANRAAVTLEGFADQIGTADKSDVQELRIVLKGDVHGSVETLRDTLKKIGNAEVSLSVLHAGVGGITENDVLLADASKAIVIGFHVAAPAVVRDIAEQRGIEIRTYRIIYDLVDDMKSALEGMLAPEVREDQLGQAEVREVFKISKLGMVAGCLVTQGAIQRGGKMRVIRDGVVVTEGRGVDSLRRVKDEAREVRVGTECGIRITGFEDVKNGDILECYSAVEVKRTLK